MNPLKRYCFTLQVDPGRLAEYAERHAHVWPEMMQALDEAGWGNYSLFLRDDGLLIGYVESDDLTAAVASMAATEVNGRWQASMAEFFVGVDGRPADESFTLVPQVFHLQTQRARGVVDGR